MSAFQTSYENYLNEFERALERHCADMRYRPAVLAESMRYSLLSGGKRLRPVLFYAALDALGQPWKEEALLALALESIHTYSLIHDDLPAMDNDDFRRGKPSSHKAFGEANAILAGDALLSSACSLMLEAGAKSERHLHSARILAEAAGADGMIAGQSADLRYTGCKGGEEELFFIYEHKTGKLIAAPLAMAATIANRFVPEFTDFGKNLGTLFQLTDDILDVKGESAALGKTTGKDEKEDKLTCVKLFGTERSETLADEYAEKCRASLHGIENVSFFLNLIDWIRSRNY